MTKQTKIRPIVRAAFKCDELVYQFTRIDVEDGMLVKGDIEEVNAKYNDEYIIGEAENRLDISQCNLEEGGWEGEMLKTYQREARQIQSFLKRFSKAVA
jgi:hypothetical protein